MKERSQQLLAEIAKIERVDKDDIFIAVGERIDKAVSNTRKNKTYQIIFHDYWDRESNVYDEGSKKAMLKKFKELDSQLDAKAREQMGYTLVSPAGFRIA